VPPGDQRQIKEGRQLARSAGLVGLWTLASRILGLIRDAVIAAYFRKDATDAFFVANTIPNALRRLMGEGSLTVAFIPVFTEYMEQRGEQASRRMLANALGTVLVVLVVVTVLFSALSPWVVRGFAYGFADEPGKLQLAVLLTRVMVVFFLTTGLAALAMGVLNTCRHFSAPALSPVVLNAVIIGSVLFGSALMLRWGLPPIMAASLGVVLGGAAQVVIQFPFLKRHNMLVAPRFGFSDPGVVRVAKLMLPAVFGLAIYEINIIIARQLASFLSEGSISYLYYAQRMIEFPMGIFAVAIATVAMPNLASHATSGHLGKLKETYRFSLRMVLFIILPATAGLVALAVPLTAVLFQRGRFSHEMALQTATTLLGYLAGLWASAGVKQTVPVFYAMQDTKTPVKVAAVSLLVYAAAALGLYRYGTVGLALAVSCSSAANFILLVLLLRRRVGLLGLRSVVASALRSGVASVVCGAAAWGVVRYWGDWWAGGAAATNYAALICAVVAGVAAFLVMAKLLGIPELKELLDAFRRRGSGLKDGEDD
jgi:putative peptidoglycan lipid II flippase